MSPLNMIGKSALHKGSPIRCSQQRCKIWGHHKDFVLGADATKSRKQLECNFWLSREQPYPLNSPRPLLFQLFTKCNPCTPFVLAARVPPSGHGVGRLGSKPFEAA